MRFSKGVSQRSVNHMIKGPRILLPLRGVESLSLLARPPPVKIC